MPVTGDRRREGNPCYRLCVCVCAGKHLTLLRHPSLQSKRSRPHQKLEMLSWNCQTDFMYRRQKKNPGPDSTCWIVNNFRGVWKWVISVWQKKPTIHKDSAFRKLSVC